MTLKELLNINSLNPDRVLLNKKIVENEAAILFYREQLKKSKDPYWKGKIGSKQKEINLIDSVINEKTLSE